MTIKVDLYQSVSNAVAWTPARLIEAWFRIRTSRGKRGLLNWESGPGDILIPTRVALQNRFRLSSRYLNMRVHTHIKKQRRNSEQINLQSVSTWTVQLSSSIGLFILSAVIRPKSLDWATWRWAGGLVLCYAIAPSSSTSKPHYSREGSLPLQQKRVMERYVSCTWWNCAR